jgi:NADH dehydrogenase [ubiquinone] 1 alpha subcomplex assembly factor 7
MGLGIPHLDKLSLQMMPSSAAPLQFTPLAIKLAARIAESGPIPFHDYMEACLYDPEHGYYLKRDPLGGGGDFITAPEISQVFGELVGLWAGEVWRLMGEPATLRLIELGPGRATLLADALRALRVLKGFLKSVTIHLVETSEPLRCAQKRMLAGGGHSIFWHAGIGEVPDGPTILIANEFLDCLPVRQFIFDTSAETWRERQVALENGTFKFFQPSDERQVPPQAVLLPEGKSSAQIPSPDQERVGVRGGLYPLSRTLAGIGAAGIEDGAILQQRPGTARMVQEFARRAGIAPLAALVIDYGYSRPSFGETVQAVKNHRFAGIFDAPGETDLTAHVDFSQLKQDALDAKLTSFGPMALGEWLLRLGLEARLRQLLASASEKDAEDLKRQVLRLVDPAQMGALFKVMALTGGVPTAPPPFS